MRILVVDDSGFSRRVLKQLFVKISPNCTVDEAKDGNTALKCIAEQNIYDLITIDLHMPGMDGLELAAVLREKNVPSKLSLISANVQEAIVGRAEGMGMVFVPKPLSEQKLSQLLGPHK